MKEWDSEGGMERTEGRTESVDPAIQRVVSKTLETANQVGKAQTDIRKFGKLVPTLIERGIEGINLSMFDDATKQAILTEVGDECLRKGKINEAVKAYIYAGVQDRLIALGENYESMGMYSNAIDMYVFAKAKERLDVIGDKCIRDAKFADAIKALNHAGNRKKLLDVGDECIKRAKWDYALEIFSIIGNKQKLIELGDMCCSSSQLFSYASRAYELAGDKDRLSRLADLCLREGLINTAYKTYALADNAPMVAFIKENFLKTSVG